MTAGTAAARVSVVLCTYNGARYLEAQLASLAHQTLAPCELVVRDDGSADATPAIVGAFAASAPFPVRWQVNATRLGSAANFGAAIADARGDLVALCDQDDVWLPPKLERLTAALAAAPAAPYAFSDATVVDEALAPLGYGLWESVRCTPAVRAALREGRGFDALLRRNVVTGATMMFRAALRDLVLPVPPEWIHDGWIALLLATRGAPAVVEAPLMLYRQHAANQVGARRRTVVDDVRRPRRYHGSRAAEAAGQFATAAHRLAAAGAPEAGRVAAKVRFLERRAALPAGLAGRAAEVARLQLAGEYARYADGVRSALKDLLRPER